MAAVDYFLKIDGIQGESVDDKHKSEIDVLSYSWGVTNSSKAHLLMTGGGAGKPDAQNFVVVKFQDKASPVLMQNAFAGKHIKTAVLTARRSGQSRPDYLKITLTDVLVSEYALAGTHASDDRPTEKIQLNFSAIKMEYAPSKPDGSLDAFIPGGVDLKSSKGM